MKLLAFCLLLGMSAQAQTTNLTGSTMDTYTFTDGYCSLGQKIEISHGTGDLAYKETLATCGSNGKWWKFQDETEFAQAAQRAADETDGKPDGKILWIDPKVYPHKPWDEVGPLGDGPNPPWPPAVLVDVPAVQVGGHLGFDGCGQSACFDHWVTDYTCTDKSRVLLTSEDGKKHCIKF